MQQNPNFSILMAHFSVPGAFILQRLISLSLGSFIFEFHRHEVLLRQKLYHVKQEEDENPGLVSESRHGVTLLHCINRTMSRFRGQAAKA